MRCLGAGVPDVMGTMAWSVMAWHLNSNLSYSAHCLENFHHLPKDKELVNVSICRPDVMASLHIREVQCRRQDLQCLELSRCTCNCNKSFAKQTVWPSCKQSECWVDMQPEGLHDAPFNGCAETVCETTHRIVFLLECSRGVRWPAGINT